MANEMNLLNEEPIKIEDLLLDPNNPRFSKHLDEITPVEKLANEEVQALAYAQMNDPANHFEIDELVEAIIADGFIHVDKIFVKKVGSKYLVIEGNRRITAIKKILRDHKDQISPERSKQISEIPCIPIDAKNPQVEDMVRKILGLRHHGSILPWKPLPAAFNLYQEYMVEHCEGDREKAKNPENFLYRPDIANRVAAMFSVKRNDVRQKVKLYRVYLQLDKESRRHPKVVSSDSFSMIEETLSRTELKKYFEYDEAKSIFSDDGVEKILDLYFGLKGKLPAITEASAGVSNVRDFAYVVSEGTPEDIRRITDNREKASAVKGDVVAKRNIHSLQKALEVVLDELNKINLGEIGTEGFAPNETKHIVDIDKKIKQLKRAAGIKDS